MPPCTHRPWYFNATYPSTCCQYSVSVYYSLHTHMSCTCIGAYIREFASGACSLFKWNCNKNVAIFIRITTWIGCWVYLLWNIRFVVWPDKWLACRYVWSLEKYFQYCQGRFFYLHQSSPKKFDIFMTSCFLLFYKLVAKSILIAKLKGFLCSSEK